MSVEPNRSRREFLAGCGAFAAAGALGLHDPAEGAPRRKRGPKKPPNARPISPPGPEPAAPPPASDPAPLDLTKLRADQFRPLVDQDFQLAGPRGAIPLVLIDVRDLRRQNDALRPDETRSEPFELLFETKNFDRVPAKIYRLSNPKLGVFDVYLNEVRADSDPATIHCAVIFN